MASTTKIVDSNMQLINTLQPLVQVLTGAMPMLRQLADKRKGKMEKIADATGDVKNWVEGFTVLSLIFIT